MWFRNWGPLFIQLLVQAQYIRCKGMRCSIRDENRCYPPQSHWIITKNNIKQSLCHHDSRIKPWYVRKLVKIIIERFDAHGGMLVTNTSSWKILTLLLEDAGTPGCILFRFIGVLTMNLGILNSFLCPVYTRIYNKWNYIIKLRWKSQQLCCTKRVRVTKKWCMNGMSLYSGWIYFGIATLGQCIPIFFYVTLVIFSNFIITYKEPFIGPT